MRIFIANRFDQPTFVRVARFDRFPRIAAGHPAFLRIEQQAAFELLGLGRVAFVTMLDEQRADFPLKKSQLVGGGLGSRGDRNAIEQGKGTNQQVINSVGSSQVHF